jgi:nicotinate-nucleotide adenylyltransferase
MGRIGVLGGTFDPPHIGHLILAEVARQQLALDTILFLPVGQPPHKREEPISPVADRLVMTRLATADNPAFVVSVLDMNRPAPHYTATLAAPLREAYPDADFWLLVGGDSLRDLPTWHTPDRVVARFRLAVLPRPGAEFEWPTLTALVPGVRAATTMLEGPAVAISSTALRARAAGGRSLRYLLPAPVIAYIRRQQLYTSSAAAIQTSPAGGRNVASEPTES